MLKRIVECAISAAVLAAASPVLLLIAAAITLHDGGPVLFTQLRVGAGRRPFRIYKFRTMRDGWITRPGTLLRATGLDELPQLVNVLAGHMSLVGPRPLTPHDVARLGWDDARHAERFGVRPGIVGLAQLFAGRGARQSWFLDCRYVEVCTPSLDAQIVLLSAGICVLGKPRVRAWVRRLRGLRRTLRSRRAASRRSDTPAAIPLSGRRRFALPGASLQTRD